MVLLGVLGLLCLLRLLRLGLLCLGLLRLGLLCLLRLEPCLLRLCLLCLLRLGLLCLLRLGLLCLLLLGLLGAPRRLRLEERRLHPTATREARGATKRKAPRRTLRNPRWSCRLCLCGFVGRGGCSSGGPGPGR